MRDGDVTPGALLGDVPHVEAPASEREVTECVLGVVNPDLWPAKAIVVLNGLLFGRQRSGFTSVLAQLHSWK